MIDSSKFTSKNKLSTITWLYSMWERNHEYQPPPVHTNSSRPQPNQLPYVPTAESERWLVSKWTGILWWVLMLKKAGVIVVKPFNYRGSETGLRSAKAISDIGPWFKKAIGVVWIPHTQGFTANNGFFLCLFLRWIKYYTIPATWPVLNDFFIKNC